MHVKTDNLNYGTVIAASFDNRNYQNTKTGKQWTRLADIDDITTR